MIATMTTTETAMTISRFGFDDDDKEGGGGGGGEGGTRKAG